MGFKGGGVKLTPPSISWFSSTPAGIGLRDISFKERNARFTTIYNLCIIDYVEDKIVFIVISRDISFKERHAQFTTIYNLYMIDYVEDNIVFIVISKDLSFKEIHARFTTIHFQPLYNRLCGR